MKSRDYFMFGENMRCIKYVSHYTFFIYNDTYVHMCCTYGETWDMIYFFMFRIIYMHMRLFRLI